MCQLTINEVNIKQLSYEDALKNKENIVSFIYESVKMSNYEELYTKEQAMDKADELCDYIHNHKAIVLGAFYKDNMIGFLWAYEYPFRDDTNRLYISIVHVLDEYRNIHIGAELLRNIEQIAKNKGFDRLYLHAEATNSKACNFYKKIIMNKKEYNFIKIL